MRKAKGAKLVGAYTRAWRRVPARGFSRRKTHATNLYRRMGGGLVS